MGYYYCGSISQVFANSLSAFLPVFQSGRMQAVVVVNDCSSSSYSACSLTWLVACLVILLLVNVIMFKAATECARRRSLRCVVVVRLQCQCAIFNGKVIMSRMETRRDLVHVRRAEGVKAHECRVRNQFERLLICLRIFSLLFLCRFLRTSVSNYIVHSFHWWRTSAK